MPDDQTPAGPGPGDDPGSSSQPGPGTPGGGTPPPSLPPEPLPPAVAAQAAAPTIMSRKELREQSAKRNGMPRAGWYAIGGVGVVIVGVVAALLATSGSKPTSAKAPIATTTSTTTKPTVTTVAAPTCPLTGAPAPGGSVPQRPALGIKIGNYPDDRPSAGLNQADIVFEEPVEGAITRLLAVFQCQEAPLVGDTRSAREPDVGILSQLSNPVFAHAGGIDPVLALLQAAPLTDENLLEGASSAIIHQPGRVAPYATFTSTSAVWALDPSDTTPPAPIFQYSATPPAGTVAGSGTSVHIPFSSTSDVTWTWNPAGNDYLRSYSGTPDKLVDGTQTAATNVVIMTVQTTTGPWLENDEGGYEVEVTDTGTGPLVVMRNGATITGTWSRSSQTQPATLTATDGTPITLQPGNTWEELVPVGITVTPSPGVAAAAATTTTTAPAATTTAPTKRK